VLRVSESWFCGLVDIIRYCAGLEIVFDWMLGMFGEHSAIDVFCFVVPSQVKHGTIL
jgi:hypothetical protein